MPHSKLGVESKTPWSPERVADEIADIIEYLLDDETAEENVSCPAHSHEQPDIDQNVFCEESPSTKA